MTEQLQTTNPTTEAQVRDLTLAELEQIDGATGSGAVLVAMGDGSVRNNTAAASDYSIWRGRFGTGG